MAHPPQFEDFSKRSVTSQFRNRSLNNCPSSIIHPPALQIVQPNPRPKRQPLSPLNPLTTLGIAVLSYTLSRRQVWVSIPFATSRIIVSPRYVPYRAGTQRLCTHVSLAQVGTTLRSRLILRDPSSSVCAYICARTLPCTCRDVRIPNLYVARVRRHPAHRCLCMWCLCSAWICVTRGIYGLVASVFHLRL